MAHLDEGVVALDNVGMLQALLDLDLLQTVCTGLCVHHIKDCNLQRMHEASANGLGSPC
jgi:hypothetical protein